MTHSDDKRSGDMPELIPAHGGYRDLKSYQMAEIVHDGTVVFCDRFVDRRSRMASGTSKKTELKLIGVARASLEELLVDFQDFLRQHGLPLWGKDDAKAREVRALCYRQNRSYSTYKSYLEPPAPPEVAANTLICVIHQTNYLLDQQLRALEKGFLEEGGFTEKLYRARSQRRDWKRKT
jgi:four helix bundle suffix protein